MLDFMTVRDNCVFNPLIPAHQDGVIEVEPQKFGRIVIGTF